MKVINPLMLIMAALNVGAAGYEALHNHNWKMAAIFFCYGITSALFGLEFK